MITKLIQNKYFKLSAGGLILLALGAGIGYFAKPSKVVTKFQEKEVIKYVENKKENKDIVTVIKKITQKDGTVIEESRTEDKTKVETDKSFLSQKEIKQQSIVINDLGLSVHALVLSNLSTLSDREYGVYIKKRVFSNISVGVMATDKQTVGLSVGMDF